MSTVITTTVGIEQNILPKDWSSSQNDKFTANEMIQAYFSGKEDGIKEHDELFKREFSVNVKLATSIAEELLETGIDNHIKMKSIHLKAENSNSFEILFLVDPESYNDDSFRNAYVIARAIKNKYKTDRVHFSFSFTSESAEITNECLAADGFFMRYEQGKKA